MFHFKRSADHFRFCVILVHSFVRIKQFVLVLKGVLKANFLNLQCVFIFWSRACVLTEYGSRSRFWPNQFSLLLSVRLLLKYRLYLTKGVTIFHLL